MPVRVKGEKTLNLRRGSKRHLIASTVELRAGLANSVSITNRVLDMTEIASSAAFRQQAAEEVFNWLLRDTYDERYIDRILVALCGRLRDVGISVARATLHLRTQQREWLGATLLWRDGLDEAEIVLQDYAVEQSDQYLLSPLLAVRSGAAELRRRLWQLPPGEYDYAILSDLRAEGLTDYVAWPMHHTLGKRQVVTFASDAPRGFSDTEIGFLHRLVPLLGLVSDARIKNVLIRTFLETYVGPFASRRILDGDTRRGFGSSIEAVTMISDLRHSTELSAEWPRDQMIALLDAYFEAIVDPIERLGGEVLKFMGDGMLAVFPLDKPDACANLILSVREGQERLGALNAENRSRGLPELRHGIGVHLGEVNYGNIGSRHRLDFTVIGPVVNIASRLQDLTREAGFPVLVSGDFAARAGRPDEFQNVGTFNVRGVPDPIEVLSLKL